MAETSASGNTSNGTTSVLHYYKDGTHTGNTVNKPEAPTNTLPVIPPRVPLTITRVNDQSRAPFTEAVYGFPNAAVRLHSTYNSDRAQQKNDTAKSSQPTNSTGLPTAINSSNSSFTPFNGTPGGQGDVSSKPSPRWLNNSGISLKNLTRNDPLYASWTGHLGTPREVTLSNTSSYLAGNSTGITYPSTQVYGNLDQEQPGRARETAHMGIDAMIQRMGVLQSYILNSSSLTGEQKAVLLDEAESNTMWLSRKDSEIQSTTDTDAIPHILADTETHMSVMEIDLQQNMGILACNEMNSRISEALNASITVNDRIGRVNLGDADRAIVRRNIEECREHLLNASLHSDNAAESFQKIDGQGNADSNYSQGLDQLRQSKKELDMAYLAINKIFHLTVDNTKL